MYRRAALCITLATAAFACGGSSHAAAGNPAAGKDKTGMCAGCHGISGYRSAFPQVYSVPKLGGQHAAYLMKALQAYKTGERHHPTMKAIAVGLSDQDMADVAAYYSAEARAGR